MLMNLVVVNLSVFQFHNSSRGLIDMMNAMGDVRDTENLTVVRRSDTQ